MSQVTIGGHGYWPFTRDVHIGRLEAPLKAQPSVHGDNSTTSASAIAIFVTVLEHPSMPRSRMHHLFLPRVLDVASFITCRQLVTRLPQRSPTLYLTFDDGPDPQETPRLLEALGSFDIKATFFVVGRAAERHPHLARAITEAGHALGNHSMTHPRFNRLSMRQQLEEIKLADRVLERFDAKSQHPFRPPYGGWTFFSMVACLLRSQKLVLWSHDSLDYRTSADEVVAYLRTRIIKSGDILLFHDDGPVARETLGQLVPEWKAAGFGFATLA